MNPDRKPPPLRVSLGAPIRRGGFDLDIDDVLITDQLYRRPAGTPDYEREAHMLSALAREMASSPSTVLARLADSIVEQGIGGSAGISILEPGDHLIFHWVAVAGALSGYLGGTMPFNASPCGAVVTRNAPLLFAKPHEHFPAANVLPPVAEVLLVPFHENAEPIGTLWVVAHDGKKRFDAEDLRLLTSLSGLASAAHQMFKARETIAATRQELEQRVDERTRDLAQSAAHFRLMADAVPHLVWVADADGRMEFANRRWREYAGMAAHPVTAAAIIAGLVHPDDQEETAAGFEKSFRTGTAWVSQHRARSASGEYRWFLARAEPYRDPETGEIVRWYGASVDIDDLHRLQETQQLLIIELQHRTRNLLALVSSTARQTQLTSASPEDFSERFFARLGALSRVQALLSRESSHSVTLRELIETELKAYGGAEQRVTLSGPDVQLSSKAVQVLALALHELGTNAVKHGALAQQQAKLAVDWTLSSEDGQEFVTVHWAETGVEVAEAANLSKGFGRQLIEQALPYDLGASTDWTLTADGVRCTLKVLRNGGVPG